MAAIVDAYATWLSECDVPKLLLFARPGAILPQELVGWCRAHMRKLTAVDIGPGLHFVQEDRPHAIGAALWTWYRGLRA